MAREAPADDAHLLWVYDSASASVCCPSCFARTARNGGVGPNAMLSPIPQVRAEPVGVFGGPPVGEEHVVLLSLTNHSPARDGQRERDNSPSPFPLGPPLPRHRRVPSWGVRGAAAVCKGWGRVDFSTHPPPSRMAWAAVPPPPALGRRLGLKSLGSGPSGSGRQGGWDEPFSRLVPCPPVHPESRERGTQTHREATRVLPTRLVWPAGPLLDGWI